DAALGIDVGVPRELRRAVPLLALRLLVQVAQAVLHVAVVPGVARVERGEDGLQLLVEPAQLVHALFRGGVEHATRLPGSAASRKAAFRRVLATCAAQGAVEVAHRLARLARRTRPRAAERPARGITRRRRPDAGAARRVRLAGLSAGTLSE